MTLVPEAWQNDDHMASEKKLFYKWASCSMEAWDGPGLLTLEWSVSHLIYAFPSLLENRQ